MDPPALALALVAGAVAAFNPCGFAMLPAYLAMLVASPGGGGGQAAALVRAARFTTGMTGGFVAVFGAFALVVAPLALAVERWLPVLTVVIGVVLLGLGAWLLSGRALGGPQWRRAGRAPSTTWGSQVGYGTAFALASLSCTLGPFLAVTTSALRGGSLLGVAATFMAYALGMGTVVGVLAVAAATASTTLTTRMRRAVPVISRLSGGLLVLAGAYVAWYGWFELRVLAGTTVSDPAVSVAITAQSAVARWVAGLGVGTVLLAASCLALVVVGGVVVRVFRQRHRDPLPVPEESRR